MCEIFKCRRIFSGAPILMVNSIWVGALFVIEDWPFYKVSLYLLPQRADSALDTSMSLRRTILVWLTNLKPR